MNPESLDFSSDKFSGLPKAMMAIDLPSFPHSMRVIVKSVNLEAGTADIVTENVISNGVELTVDAATLENFDDSDPFSRVSDFAEF